MLMHDMTAVLSSWQFIAGRSRACGWLLIMATALAGGCAPDIWDRSLRFEPDHPQASVVLFWVDGMAQDKVHALLEQGELPGIRRTFVEGGAEYVNTLDSLPSITYINSGSIFTGCYPYRHGIYGNIWFDRSDYRFRNYESAGTFSLINRDLERPTVYEYLANLHTISVQCHTNRGSAEAINNVLTSGFDWMIGDLATIEQNAGTAAVGVIERAKRQQRWPALLTVYFPSPDSIAHAEGADTSDYAAALENIDQQIARVVDAVDAADPPLPVYTFLITDHGEVVSPAQMRIDVVDWLRVHRNMQITESPRQANSKVQRRMNLNPYGAVAIRDGGRRLVLHLRGRRGWLDTPTPAEVRRIIDGDSPDATALVDAPGVGLVCYRDGDSIRVLSARGEARIRARRHDDRYRYRYDVLSGESPLGTVPPAWGRHRWRNAQEWLESTAGDPYPNAIPQLYLYFQSPRAGDLLVFADRGWSFIPDSPSGHGSALASDTRVSMFVRGPGIRRGTQTTPIRLVDLTPTIIELVTGHPIDTDDDEARDFDGISLLETLGLPPARGSDTPRLKPHEPGAALAPDGPVR